MEADAGPAPADAFRCSGNAMCVQDNARFCDATDGVCRGCEDSGQVSDECDGLGEGTGFCAVDGRCVECLANAECTTSASPTCDAVDFQCRPCAENDDCIGAIGGEKCSRGSCVECTAHSDCGSEVCDPDNHTCASASTILYVGGANAADIDDPGGCGAALLPCASITFGLVYRVSAATHAYMAVRPANYLENLDISGMTLKIIGPGATVISALVDTPVISVAGGAGTDILVDGMTFRSAFGTADGIYCQDTSTLRVRNVEIHNNARRGIYAAFGCTVTVVGAHIHDNGDSGVYAFGADLTITDSEIESNDNGGVRIRATGFRLLNNFIVDNGDSNAQAAISIENVGDGILLQDMLFNTVAGNRADNIASASGVECGVDPGSNPTIVGNLVYDNTGPANSIFGSNCAWEYSNIEGVPAAGTNISATPQFINPNGGNYHIGLMSPCIDKVLIDTGIDYDIDGDRRDGLPDIGADEIDPP